MSKTGDHLRIIHKFFGLSPEELEAGAPFDTAALVDRFMEHNQLHWVPGPELPALEPASFDDSKSPLEANSQWYYDNGKRLLDLLFAQQDSIPRTQLHMHASKFLLESQETLLKKRGKLKVQDGSEEANIFLVFDQSLIAVSIYKETMELIRRVQESKEEICSTLKISEENLNQMLTLALYRVIQPHSSLIESITPWLNFFSNAAAHLKRTGDAQLVLHLSLLSVLCFSCMRIFSDDFQAKAYEAVADGLLFWLEQLASSESCKSADLVAAVHLSHIAQAIRIGGSKALNACSSKKRLVQLTRKLSSQISEEDIPPACKTIALTKAVPKMLALMPPKTSNPYFLSIQYTCGLLSPLIALMASQSEQDVLALEPEVISGLLSSPIPEHPPEPLSWQPLFLIPDMRALQSDNFAPIDEGTKKSLKESLDSKGSLGPLESALPILDSIIHRDDPIWALSQHSKIYQELRKQVTFWKSQDINFDKMFMGAPLGKEEPLSFSLTFDAAACMHGIDLLLQLEKMSEYTHLATAERLMHLKKSKENVRKLLVFHFLECVKSIAALCIHDFNSKADPEGAQSIADAHDLLKMAILFALSHYKAPPQVFIVLSDLAIFLQITESVAFPESQLGTKILRILQANKEPFYLREEDIENIATYLKGSVPDDVPHFEHAEQGIAALLKLTRDHTSSVVPLRKLKSRRMNLMPPFQGVINLLSVYMDLDRVSFRDTQGSSPGDDFSLMRKILGARVQAHCSSENPDMQDQLGASEAPYCVLRFDDIHPLPEWPEARIKLKSLAAQVKSGRMNADSLWLYLSAQGWFTRNSPLEIANSFIRTLSEHKVTIDHKRKPEQLAAIFSLLALPIEGIARDIWGEKFGCFLEELEQDAFNTLSLEDAATLFIRKHYIALKPYFDLTEKLWSKVNSIAEQLVGSTTLETKKTIMECCQAIAPYSAPLSFDYFQERAQDLSYSSVHNIKKHCPLGEKQFALLKEEVSKLRAVRVRNAAFSDFQARLTASFPGQKMLYTPEEKKAILSLCSATCQLDAPKLDSLLARPSLDLAELHAALVGLKVPESLKSSSAKRKKKQKKKKKIFSPFFEAASALLLLLQEKSSLSYTPPQSVPQATTLMLVQLLPLEYMLRHLWEERLPAFLAKLPFEKLKNLSFEQASKEFLEELSSASSSSSADPAITLLLAMRGLVADALSLISDPCLFEQGRKLVLAGLKKDTPTLLPTGDLACAQKCLKAFVEGNLLLCVQLSETLPKQYADKKALVLSEQSSSLLLAEEDKRAKEQAQQKLVAAQQKEAARLERAQKALEERLAKAEAEAKAQAAQEAEREQKEQERLLQEKRYLAALKAKRLQEKEDSEERSLSPPPKQVKQEAPKAKKKPSSKAQKVEGHPVQHSLPSQASTVSTIDSISSKARQQKSAVQTSTHRTWASLARSQSRAPAPVEATIIKASALSTEPKAAKSSDTSTELSVHAPVFTPARMAITESSHAGLAAQLQTILLPHEQADVGARLKICLKFIWPCSSTSAFLAMLHHWAPYLGNPHLPLVPCPQLEAIYPDIFFDVTQRLLVNDPALSQPEQYFSFFEGLASEFMRQLKAPKRLGLHTMETSSRVLQLLAREDLSAELALINDLLDSIDLGRYPLCVNIHFDLLYCKLMTYKVILYAAQTHQESVPDESVANLRAALKGFFSIVEHIRKHIPAEQKCNIQPLLNATAHALLHLPERCAREFDPALGKALVNLYEDELFGPYRRAQRCLQSGMLPLYPLSFQHA